MKAKQYAILCVAVAVVTVAIILFVPGLSDTIEGRLLTFLSTNARA
jgi:hypothetical protein